jgi:hypothetical protein
MTHRSIFNNMPSPIKADSISSLPPFSSCAATAAAAAAAIALKFHPKHEKRKQKP